MLEKYSYPMKKFEKNKFDVMQKDLQKIDFKEKKKFSKKTFSRFSSKISWKPHTVPVFPAGFLKEVGFPVFPAKVDTL